MLESSPCLGFEPFEKNGSSFLRHLLATATLVSESVAAIAVDRLR
jgi:hypothetical protein